MSEDLKDKYVVDESHIRQRILDGKSFHGDELKVEVDNDQLKSQTKSKVNGLIFPIKSVPPIHIVIINVLQQLFLNIGGPLSTTYLIHGTICSSGNILLLAQMLSTTMFMCGIATLVQTSIGVRLPIIQGSSGTFLPPITAMMSTQQWRCPVAINGTSDGNFTEGHEPWRYRIREISGGIIVASMIEVVVGMFGIVGVLRRFIGPLTITPAISLISISLYQMYGQQASAQWGIATFVIALIIFFSVIIGHINIPIPAWTRERSCHVERYPVFRLFTHILAMGFGWLLSYILTVTNVFPDDASHPSYAARTDSKLYVLEQATWFYFPFPFQWGLPTFGPGIIVGMMAAVIASTIESIGDYYATALACELPAPPKHAMNRGILCEGVCSIASGMVGACHATTSYSGNVAYIAITGMGSRVVWIGIGLAFTVCGMVGKIGAILAIVPEPVIAGLTIGGMALLLSVSLQPLRYIDLTSPRNMTILGISILFPFSLSEWIKANPDVIDTGNKDVDQMLQVFLSTAMFMGGLLGFILDNIVPGTPEERGIKEYLRSVFSAEQTQDKTDEDLKTYDIPYITKYMKRVNCLTYIPCLPSYTERPCPCHCCRKKTDKSGTERHSVPQ